LSLNTTTPTPNTHTAPSSNMQASSAARSTVFRERAVQSRGPGGGGKSMLGREAFGTLLNCRSLGLPGAEGGTGATRRLAREPLILREARSMQAEPAVRPRGSMTLTINLRAQSAGEVMH
jgi:hypothetical protein